MFWRNFNVLTLLSGASILLAICIWPIICYNFVLNNMHLLVSALSISKTETEVNDLEKDPTPFSDVALAITMYAGLILSEGILVVCLVIQFMSSFDYLVAKGQEYEANWWICHRKVLLLNGILLSVKLAICFLFLSLSSAEVTDSLLELYAMTLNFFFLVVAVNISAVGGPIGRRFSDLQRLELGNGSSTQSVQNIIDRPPSYGEVVRQDEAFRKNDDVNSSEVA